MTVEREPGTRIKPLFSQRELAEIMKEMQASPRGLDRLAEAMRSVSRISLNGVPVSVTAGEGIVVLGLGVDVGTVRRISREPGQLRKGYRIDYGSTDYENGVGDYNGTPEGVGWIRSTEPGHIQVSVDIGYSYTPRGDDRRGTHLEPVIYWDGVPPAGRLAGVERGHMRVGIDYLRRILAFLVVDPNGHRVDGGDDLKMNLPKAPEVLEPPVGASNVVAGRDKAAARERWKRKQRR